MKKLLLPLITALIAAPTLAPLNAQPVDGGHARVELISERETAIPGETVWFGLSFEMVDEWHIYWKNAGDAGIPPRAYWDDQTTVDAEAIGAIDWPLPELLPVVEGEIMDYGYSGEIVLPFPVQIPENATGPVRLGGEIDYLICKDICIPESVDLAVTLNVGPQQVPDRENGARIAEALADVPVYFTGEVSLTAKGESWTLSASGGELVGASGDTRFFPDGHEIVHAAPQPVEFGEQGLAIELTPARPGMPEALTGVIRVAVDGEEPVAVRISASEGDVLAGTSGLGSSGGEATTAGGGTGGLTSGAGGAGGGLNFFVLIGSALLGGLILNLMPCVLPVLSIKAIGMVQVAARGERGELRKHGLWYTAGVLISFAATGLAFIALRAAGQFVSLGFQLQYPAVVAALALIMVLIGLWLLGVVNFGSSVQNVGSGLAGRQGSAGAFFTGVLAAVVGAPCVGPFVVGALGAVLNQPWPVVMAVFLMLGFGLALPFLVLSYVPGLHKSLPKPGLWMERLKQAFAFPMFLTAAWLITVLGNHPAAGATAFGAVILAFGIWLISVAGGRLRTGLVAAGAVLALVGIAWPVASGLQEAPATSGVAASYAAAYEPEPWSPTRVDELIGEGRGVFVDFTASWCATCQVNKRTTLKREDVLEAMDAANVTFLVADFTRPNDEISDELKRRGSPGVPMYLLYAPGEPEPEILPTLLNPGMLKRKLEAFLTTTAPAERMTP
ncbi:cytochrome C biogenesis protein [Henriciella barbarensis]|uniref:Cytochrome C biogenesis protein n=1 Tax=Henriciella barbarensis TaxID=86342 RepID=A0A399R5U9_9PROT|nr:protein-disulfide reductase DsbD domain-containing protein [Henriciella barbarensis]RIJ25941.1 cytochrome C biogenesis protein [Henriciella barbarensis]